MKAWLARWLICGIAVCLRTLAATDALVTFTLTTTDEDGALMTESRKYYVYRPDNLSRSVRAPMVLVANATLNGGPATLFHSRADQAGFLVVTCEFTGNSLGGVWNNDDPRVTGYEDYDYISAVIKQVAAAENAGDAFLCGLSKGGHMAYAFACERPSELKAACSVDEFMGLTSNIPSAPIPILALHGTVDVNVPYTMGKDSIDAWRAVDGLMGASAVTTYESSPLIPGQVTRTTWRGGIRGAQVAFVTIVGGDHRWPTLSVQTGYDGPAGVWTFFSEFLTPTQAAPRIVAAPANATQYPGQPASFWAVGSGDPPLHYQWQRNGADIAGATDNWLTIPAVATGDNGAMFRAVVTNASGTVTSPAATLTVKPLPAGPVITAGPASRAVTAGQSVAFTVTATGTGTLQYQWRKNGVALPGAVGASYTLPVALTSDSGATISVVVTDTTGTATSAPAALSVVPAPGAPIILTNPARSRVLIGQSGSFSVSASSATPMTYQWQKGAATTAMVDIPGATAATYVTPPSTAEDQHALFRCVVTNAAGASVSASEMLFATAAPTPPTDISSATVAYAVPGAAFTYTLTTSSGTVPLTFGATGLPSGLTVDANTGVISGTPAVAGVFPVTLSIANSAGATSARLTLTVAAPQVQWGQERLANLSTRGFVGTGEGALIAGFSVQGGAARTLLVRAIGPGLQKFGVDGALADPRFTIVDGAGRTVLVVDDWDARTSVAAVAASVGAFALDPGSKDAAAVTTLSPGNYTVRVEGASPSQNGIALVEVYDADAPQGSGRLANLSTRGIAGRDPGAMIAGFVIAGTQSRPVLIRAIGAGTLAPFGVVSGLGNPALEIYTVAGALVAQNDDWAQSRDAALLPWAAAGSGGFALPSPSKDAEILAVLPPGGYTAKVVNRDQPDGVALVEVYQAPALP